MLPSTPLVFTSENVIKYLVFRTREFLSTWRRTVLSGNCQYPGWWLVTGDSTSVRSTPTRSPRWWLCWVWQVIRRQQIPPHISNTVISTLESFTTIQGDQEVFMAEKSFLNLTCIIHSVETPHGVYWRHNNQLLTSQADGLLTVSPLARRSNTTFSISLSVWLTSTRQSGESQPCERTVSHHGGLQATISVFPPTPNKLQFLSMFSTVNKIQ